MKVKKIVPRGGVCPRHPPPPLGSVTNIYRLVRTLLVKHTDYFDLCTDHLNIPKTGGGSFGI